MNLTLLSVIASTIIEASFVIKYGGISLCHPYVRDTQHNDQPNILTQIFAMKFLRSGHTLRFHVLTIISLL